MNILTSFLKVTGQTTPFIDVTIAQATKQLVPQPYSTTATLKEQQDALIMGWGLLQMYGAQALLGPESTANVRMVTLPERVAEYLLAACDDQTGLIQGMSFQVLADSLGTHRETISAIMRAFKRQGIVDVGFRYIRIIDNAALQELCGADEWR